jgi:hydantoinase/carbamoylase family amidase
VVTPFIDGPRLLGRLQELGAIGANGPQGITRLAWSPEDRDAVRLVAEWAGEAGATVSTDSVGNLIAERPGSFPGARPLVTGSHLDTVVGAGSLDGAYGVIAGVEVLAGLQAASVALRHPLRVVAYANEEGVVAPPFTGSRAIVGEVAGTELGWLGPDGITLSDRLRAAGCDPSRLAAATWQTPVAATVELHIEQGPVLDLAGIALGVVTAITAQRRGSITISGEANHAGTTPMEARRDALVAVARLVLFIEQLATDGPANVATVGRLHAFPGVTNVVPGRTEMSFDVRAIDDGRCAEAVARLRERAAALQTESGMTITIDELPPTGAVPTDGDLRRIIAEVAAASDLQTLEMASGAGHDCAHLARLGPVAMAFVPSVGGVSHNALESTPAEALRDGAAVLLGTLLRADEVLDP